MKVALFDIDHTLVDVLTYHEPAYATTMSAVFGVRRELRDIEFSGKTTPAILRELALSGGLRPDHADELLPEALDLFNTLLLAGLDADLRPRVLPGIPQLLACLQRRGVFLGVVTGNPPMIGNAVLRRSGLEGWFAVCAFGTEAQERWELVKLAVERAEQAARARFAPGDVVVVGDSRHDVAAGKAYGARTVAFGTGLTPAPELAKAAPDFLFPDASDHKAVCRAIGAGLALSPNGAGRQRSSQDR